MKNKSYRGFGTVGILISLGALAIVAVGIFIYLNHSRPVAVSPEPTPIASTPASPTGTPSPAPAPTPTPNPSPSPTPTPSGPSGALSLGTVSNAHALSACPAGFLPGSNCAQVTVSCPGTADITATYGVKQPAGTSKGTIIFHAGSGGTNPFNMNMFNAPFTQAGYSLATVAWASQWEDTGLAKKNVQVAACRPATLFNYIFKTVADSASAKCLLGFSGGSAAVAYSLAEYGAGSYLDKAMFWSGPPLADFEQGCMVPAAAPATVCSANQFGCVAGDTFTDKLSFTANGPGVSQWTGIPGCAGPAPTTPEANAAWKAMSVVDGLPNSSFNYPHTSLSAFVCDNGVNNSAAEGSIFYKQFTNASQVASLKITPVKSCQAAEGVTAGQTPDGGSALTAIINDMTDPVNGCVAHSR